MVRTALSLFAAGFHIPAAKWNAARPRPFIHPRPQPSLKRDKGHHRAA